MINAHDGPIDSNDESLTETRDTEDESGFIARGKARPDKQPAGRTEPSARGSASNGDQLERDDLVPDLAGPILTPVPFLVTRSGRYLYTRKIVFPPQPIPIPHPLPIGRRQPGGAENGEKIFDEDVNAIALYQREEVQVDVDGRFPQMAISATRSGALTVAAHWVASVTKVAAGKYEGPIWYKDGNPNAIPHTFIRATVSGGPFLRKLEITFSGGGAAAFTRTYDFDSPYHRKVEFEYDRVVGATAVTSIATHDHPTRPASLPNETLSLETVYRRAGFNVSMSGGDSAIPISGSGSNARWSDQEMHDAMQIHWSRFANKPQWSLWVLFAALHEQGTSLGGIMFDDIGPNHRQGTAIFSDAFIATPPAGDAAPSAWVKRMRFWTAAHEMGHAFNLAHSWQKAASPTLPGNPWIALANEPEARSFMNYPYSVAGGQAAFFANFAYRFSDAELLFMRHAPSRFVEMGNANWFTNHGFQEAALHGNQEFELKLSVNAPDYRFAYLTPPVVELALVNRSARPKVIEASRLSERAELALIINPEGRPPTRWLPYLRHCGEDDAVVLKPGEALYDSVMAGAGSNGWDMAEPGRYTLQAVLSIDDQPVYSNQLVVTVEAPRSRDEERVAADMFTPEVGQVLSVNGTRGLDRVNAVLEEALALRDNPVSKLAAVAIATPLARDFKLLREGSDDGGDGRAAMLESESPDRKVETYKADPAEARRLLAEASEGGADEVVNALGHTRYLRETPKLAAALGDGNDDARALTTESVSATREAAAAAFSVSGELAATLNRKAAGLSR